jgi:hypothetical protein
MVVKIPARRHGCSSTSAWGKKKVLLDWGYETENKIF